MPTQTLYVWARKGLLPPRATGRGVLYSLAEAAALRTPAEYVPVPEAALRINVPVTRLRGWERHRRVPAFTRISERRTGIARADIARIRAWHVWAHCTKWLLVDYPPLYDLYQAQFSVEGFERALADNAIPARFDASHYDARGWRYSERQPDQTED